jgi:hypothetical protein
LPFNEVIRSERQLARRSLPSQDRVRSYLSRSFYAPQIRELRRLFPDDQLLFLQSEGLSMHPQAVLTQICGFLGVPSHEFEVSERSNAAPYAMSVPDEERAYLGEMFRHDAEETRRLLGWDNRYWSV